MGVSLIRKEWVTVQLFQLQIDDCFRCPVKRAVVIRERGILQVARKVTVEFCICEEDLLLDRFDECCYWPFGERRLDLE